MTTTWTRLLDGPEAEAAVATAREIADELLSPDSGIDVRQTGSSLSNGLSGQALLFAYLGEVTGDDAARETATDLLGRAVEIVSEESAIDPGLYGQTLGVGWALARLSGRLYEADDEESDLDDLVDRFLSFDPWPGHYDLISGLVGFGVYWLDRLPHPRALAGIEQTIARLEQIARRDGGHTTWFTTPQMFPARAHQYPEGHYDLGLAHGVAGVVAFLAEAVAAGVERARPLLAESTAWLTSHKIEDRPDTRYPGMFDTPDHPAGIRGAWCYGDPGVSVALLAAGNALGSADVVAEAATTVRACAGRTEALRIDDTGLCHGSTGLAHILNRVGQAIGDEQVLERGRFWFRRTLEMRQPGTPVAGFPAMNPMEGAYEARPGVLEGAAGVGLALLSAASDVPPWWDRFYLIADGTLDPR